MKTMKRKLEAVLAVLLLIATLFGCEPKSPNPNDTQEQANGPLKFNGVEAGAYTLVYDKTATGGAKNVADYFNDRLTELYNVTLTSVTDPEEDRYEILIGLDGGNAAIAAAAKDQEGFLGADGKRIYVLGMNGGAMRQVVDYLLAKAEESKAVTVPSAETVEIKNLSIKAMTYNILQSWDKDGRPSDFIAKMANTIKTQNPDVFGTQESTTTLLDALKATGNLDAYTCYKGMPHQDNTYLGNYVYWKTDKFTEIKKGHWFMSDTPSMQSKYAESNSFRGFTYVVLEDKETKIQFMFISVHTDYRGSQGDPNDGVASTARTKQLKVLTKFLKEKNPDNLPVVILGDFNDTPGQTSIQTFLKDNPRINMTSKTAERKEDVGGTLATNGFVKREPYIFDYIFVSTDRIATKYYSVVNNITSGKYPSDHLPVVSELDIY